MGVKYVFVFLCLEFFKGASTSKESNQGVGFLGSKVELSGDGK